MSDVLCFKNVKKYFTDTGFLSSSRKTVKAVDGVTFFCRKGKTFGLVGESGSGKSTVARLAAGILKPDDGEVTISGEKDMVFQDPYGSLNPRMTVRQIVGEPLLVKGVRKNEIAERVNSVLWKVRLDALSTVDKYPHQFSGGERQRIAIARALIKGPELIILDEPVSSLDVSIQADILNLLKDLQEELSLTYLFISHDLRVVEFMSDTVGVMKDGLMVEISSREEIYTNPKDPYTRKLLDSIPVF
ncbi:MAG TPA: ATP-binding cassette domain-containing protein [Candidatus Omnitrophota bacterium]|nr:ATP-binding cassette domain-containing protein [Candidatus Omnitrophota bacterium]